MNFLSIDCSTDIGSLFVKTKNKTFSKVLQSDKLSNDLLMKHILDLFKENDLEFDDMSQIFENLKLCLRHSLSNHLIQTWTASNIL